ncbi:CAP domain-containing protein [Vreelandella andesensis]|uniref:CAP domain-containing protein n=1 Tax=Vreelandella andesensis TaxID=447567 RepID=A0A3S0Y4G1_9GAMM|nr:CAP domain-containing protein [Halomonas andesensis]RUR32179.1 CAP domain-containing protein [Halomonas andesensis]
MKNLAANVTSKHPAHWALFSAITLLLISISSSWANDESQIDTTESECGLSDQQRQMLTLVNEARNHARQCGDQKFPTVSPLNWSCQLEAAADMHAKNMAKNNYFSHTDSNGAGVEQRVDHHGYVWQAVGENIAAGHISAETVIKGWLESPGHCSNIMNDAFTEMGMASANNTDSRYTTYWAQTLGTPR